MCVEKKHEDFISAESNRQKNGGVGLVEAPALKFELN